MELGHTLNTLLSAFLVSFKALEAGGRYSLSSFRPTSCSPTDHDTCPYVVGLPSSIGIKKGSRGISMPLEAVEFCIVCSLPAKGLWGRDVLPLGLVLLIMISLVGGDGGLEDKESDVVNSGIDEDDEDDGSSTGNSDGGDSRMSSTSILSAEVADDSEEAGVDAVIGTLVYPTLAGRGGNMISLVSGCDCKQLS